MLSARKQHNKQVQKHTIENAAMLFQLRGSLNIVQMLGYCNTTIAMERAVGRLDKILREKNSAKKLWT